MATRNKKTKLYLGISILVLATIACGSVQVGVVTQTPNEAVQQIVEDQISISDVDGSTNESEPSEEIATEMDVSPEDISEDPVSTVAVIAWLGHIASLPEGSQFDDMVVLSPEGAGEFGLTGATPEIEAEIRSLRDADGPNEFAHLWGDLSCSVEDYNNCQLLVNKLQYGANYSEEEVVGWTGILKNHTFNGGDSTVFELPGDFPMWYSIHASQDETLQAQIADLRDTGAIVQVSGKLMVGIPDVNGTRIEVSTLEVLEYGTEFEPQFEADFEITTDWPVFVNERYGYQIKYPMGATLSFHGPEGFSAEDKPSDMTPEQYMDSLLKEYTDRLCVKIEYSLGWIYIAAPPNKEKSLTPCGPTGVGAGELIPMIQPIYIGDQLYKANGHEMKLKVNDGADGFIMGETLDLHYEMFIITLEDGTVIRYGSTPNHNATYADYLMKTKDMLLTIIATYQSTK